MPTAPDDAAQLIYDAMAPSLSAEALHDYGLDPSTDTSEVLREILSLNLYWAESALTAALRKKAARVVASVHRRLAVRCAALRRPGEEARDLFEEARKRGTAYDHIVQQGGEPIAVFREAAEALESRGVLSRDTREKFLAFCIDMVPVDQFGALVEDLDLSDDE